MFYTTPGEVILKYVPGKRFDYVKVIDIDGNIYERYVHPSPINATVDDGVIYLK